MEAALGVGTASTISTAYHIAQLGLKIKSTTNLHILMARAAFAMAQFDESMKWNDTALHEAPNNAQAIYLRSFQLFILHQSKQAQKWRAHALMLDPDLKTKMRVLAVNKEKNTVVDLEKNLEKLMSSQSKK